MLDLLVEGDFGTVKSHDLAIDTHARKAFLVQVGKELGELAFSAGNDGGHDYSSCIIAVSKAQDLVSDLVSRLLLDDATAFRAMRDADTREKQSKVVVNLGGRPDRRSGITACCFLVD